MPKPIKTQINQFLADLENIPEELNKEINKQVDFTELLKGTHEKEQNPYGKKWATRKHKYNHPILDKTGRLKNSYKQFRHKNDITIKNTATYAKYHQTGTKKMAKRQLLPEIIIPEMWWRKIEKVWSELLNKKNR